jgi:hypothetical protein
MFYTDDAKELIREVDGHVSRGVLVGERPAIIVAPHAGIVYSGECAGYAYAQLKDQGFKRVLLVGPSHYVGFEGFAFSPADVWRTPLGEIPIDRAAIDAYLADAAGKVFEHPSPHEKEHSLELQLPFLQRVLGAFTLIPVVYGQADYKELAAIYEAFSDPETIIVVSSDLSHFYTEAEANTLDAHCNLGVENLDPDELALCEACGKTGIMAAVKYAQAHGLRSRLLNYMTSAKHSGDYSRVVGYASYIFY